jgi:hypothetical protein
MTEWMALSEELAAAPLEGDAGRSPHIRGGAVSDPRTAPRWLALALAIAAAAVGAGGAGCKDRPDDGTAPQAAAAELPALDLRDDTPNLLLTWIDDKGDAHVELRP